MPSCGEEITPRDEGPQRAYLTGVDRSSVFLLILGSRYIITDQTGYSPTHQEGNRAAEQRIPRLLFELASLKDSERDGRLNDWLILFIMRFLERLLLMLPISWLSSTPGCEKWLLRVNDCG